MLIYVTRSGKMSFKSHFGKRLWRIFFLFSLFEYNCVVFSISTQIAFLNFKCHFLQKNVISDFIFFWVCRVISSELNKLQSCVIYHFKSNFV